MNLLQANDAYCQLHLRHTWWTTALDIVVDFIKIGEFIAALQVF